MTQDLTIPQGQISADRADRMTAWWPRSPQSHIATKTDRDQIEASIDVLCKPCDPAWLMARVMALLMPYFTSDVPQGLREMEAEDWLVALRDRPMWAIDKASRWWKGDENPNRHRKPLEGDITARVKFEMGVLSFGAMKVREFDASHTKRIAETERQAPTPEEMAHRRAFAQQELRKAGFSKAMPKDEPVKQADLRDTVTAADRAEMAAMLGAAK